MRTTALRRLLVRLVLGVAVVVATVATTLPPVAGAPVGDTYRPPVDAPVVDDFAPPVDPWGSGNRGVDYETPPGAAVAASAGGVVSFAGPVGGDLHVTVTHPDGLRTTYSYLATVAVVAGDQIPPGGIVGTSAGRFHFGVRDATGAYLDPRQLFAVGVARLVPGGDDGAVVVVGPSGPGVWGVLADLALGGIRMGMGASVPVLPEVVSVAPAFVHYADRFGAMGVLRDASVAILAAAVTDGGPCTEASVATPAPGERRVLVLVAGFGSTSGQTGVDGVDAAALGYDPADVLRFSYGGGRTPAPEAAGQTPLGALPSSDYGPSESLGDLPAAGRELADLLDAVAEAAPGVPIDVVAHSQGGVVARLGISEAAGSGDLPEEVQTLVTLGSPHQGADLATAGAAIASTPRGAAVLDLAGSLGVPVAADSPALEQLSETSSISRNPGGAADGRGFPPDVHFTSIAARGDVVVPSPRTQAPGARTTTVSVSGAGAHDALPGSPEATREIALAVGGLPPTCRSRGDRMADAAVGHGISAAQDGAGAALLTLAALL